MTSQVLPSSSTQGSQQDIEMTEIECDLQGGKPEEARARPGADGPAVVTMWLGYIRDAMWHTRCRPICGSTATHGSAGGLVRQTSMQKNSTTTAERHHAQEVFSDASLDRAPERRRDGEDTGPKLLLLVHSPAKLDRRPAVFPRHPTRRHKETRWPRRQQRPKAHDFNDFMTSTVSVQL